MSLDKNFDESKVKREGGQFATKEGGKKKKDTPKEVATSKEVNPTDDISPGEIEPVNDIRNQELFDHLVSEFEDEGYTGRPVLIVENPDGGFKALTGSHRILAAQDAGIDIPAVVIPQEHFDDINFGDDDDGVAFGLKRMAKENPDLKDAAKLMAIEIDRSETDPLSAENFKSGD